MKIGLLHLTDLHFTVNTNYSTKLKPIVNILNNDFHDCKKIYLLFGGDITYSGNKEQFSKAKTFIDAIKKIFKESHGETELKPLFVPGNHDCTLKYNTGVRDVLLKSINYETLGNDNSLARLLLEVQKDFWGFYGFYYPIPDDKLFYIIEDEVERKKIKFYCINTAWMSKYHEEPGALFFPVKNYQSTLNKDEPNTIKIGLWHHPINWFNPSTKENNKNEFQTFIEALCPIHFLGHEHENDHRYTSNKNTKYNTHLLSGSLFNDDKKSNISGLQSVKIDLGTLETVTRQYLWDSEHYLLGNENNFSLEINTKRLFSLKKEIEKELNSIKIPLLLNKKEVTLLDLFIFPDLEPTNSKSLDKLESYIDAERLLDSEFQNSILDGDSQIGKTALLSAVYLSLQKSGHFPLIISGDEIKTLELDKILKRQFTKQYENSHNEFEKYMQIDKSKRILLIDDYHKSTLNTVSTKSLFEEAAKKFSRVIVTTDSNNGLLPSMQSEFQDWKFYSIKPFGYKKRNDLIETYHYLKENPITFDEDNFIEYTKFSFDSVQNILGNKLMPSYPIFILSILQALEYQPLKHQETSFGYCYQTLIHYALNNAGISNEYIDTYFNFLTELAYFCIHKESDNITREEYDNFYFEYQKDYYVPSFDIVHGMLLKSKILSEKENIIGFGYKYILYYLSAKKISDQLHLSDGKTEIKNLFKDVHTEKNANILVFVTHHSKDISFIEESMMNSMIVLDNMQPITLFKTDPFYTIVQGIAKEIQNDVLDINSNPREERRKHLKIKDESEREADLIEEEFEKKDDSYEEVKSKFKPFLQSFRSIEIIGQILRNRKGSLTKSQIQEMIREVFTTGFRTVSFVSELLTKDKDDIIAMIVDESSEEEPRSEIENRVNMFVQMLCLQTCFGVFNKLIFSVGNKEMRETYKKVAEEINTPAAKLVSFGINSYYGTISIPELREINDEFKDNLVAHNLLKARVKSYVYNRKIDFKTKQQIADTLKMSLNKANTFAYKQT